MNTFMEFMETRFSPIAAKIEKQKFIASIKNGMVSLIAVLIIGSFTLIITSLGNLFPDGTIIKNFFVENQELLSLPFQFTFGLLSIYAAITISYNHAKQIGAPILHSIVGAVLTTLVLNTRFIDGVLDSQFLDSRGLFVAIISSLAVVEVLKLFIVKNLSIRIKGLPEMVAATFESVVPLLTVLTSNSY